MWAKWLSLPVHDDCSPAEREERRGQTPSDPFGHGRTYSDISHGALARPAYRSHPVRWGDNSGDVTQPPTEGIQDRWNKWSGDSDPLSCRSWEVAARQFVDLAANVFSRAVCTSCVHLVALEWSSCYRHFLFCHLLLRMPLDTIQLSELLYKHEKSQSSEDFAIYEIVLSKQIQSHSNCGVLDGCGGWPSLHLFIVSKK